MRCAVALFAFLLIAPIALFWNAFASKNLPNQPPPHGRVFRPHLLPEVSQKFDALVQQHEKAKDDYQRDLGAVSADADPGAIAEKNPDRKFFRRFLELAEQHLGDPTCPRIVTYALACCGGPHLTPEDHIRVKTILAQHHSRSSPVPCVD
jgi:hypothetical protein